LNRARPSQLSALAATFEPNIGFQKTHSGASGNKLDAINVKLKKALGQHSQAGCFAPSFRPKTLIIVADEVGGASRIILNVILLIVAVALGV
jgi:hypothetical protein